MSIDKLIHVHFISIYAIAVLVFIIVIYLKLKNKKGPKHLTKEKFEATLSKKMIDVTHDNTKIYNIWPFVNELKKAKILPKKLNEDELIYKVYIDAHEKFEHILLQTAHKNHYVVIVVNLNKKKAKGYYKLESTNQYQ